MMATKTKPVFDDETQAKIDAFAEANNTTAEKVVALAVRNWLDDYDRGRWPHAHSALEPSPELS